MVRPPDFRQGSKFQSRHQRIVVLRTTQQLDHLRVFGTEIDRGQCEVRTGFADRADVAEELARLRDELELLANSARTANLDEIHGLAKALASVYSGVNQGRLPFSEALLELAREGHEALMNMMDCLAAGQTVRPELGLVDSLRDLERKAEVQLDPARFRANLVLDGWPGFSELDMMDREIRIGDARLKVIFETRRCAATEVNPETAERDLKVPQLLHKNFGHMNMGVYAEVLEPGHIASGDKVTLI